MNNLKRLLVILIFFQVGCEAVHENLDPSPMQKPFETKIDFATIKREVLEPACIRCHTGRHQAFESYAIVKASLSGIQSRALLNRSMPPAGASQLTDTQFTMLQEWIGGGAPEFVTDEPSPPSPISEIGFAEIKASILKPYCIQCHTHFNEFKVVKSSLGSIFSLVNQNKMPFPPKKDQPVNPLPDNLKKMLADWVNGGSPEVGGVPDGPIAPMSLEPTWISLRNNVFGPKCIMCHNNYGPRGPTSMETYKELLDWAVDYKPLINEESPNDSHLVGSMLGRVDEDEFFFDRMPLNSEFDDVMTTFNPVSPEEIKVIDKWIELGLPYSRDELP